MENIKYSPGDKQEKLTIIEFIKHKGYLCKCDCGNEKIIKLSKAIKSCGCLRKGPRIHTRKENNLTAKRHVWYYYKQSACERNYEFNLTFEEFLSIVEQNCFYCGREPNLRTKTHSRYKETFKCNGIDRVDNSIGYELSNCVSCCKICNSSKGQLTIDEFENWIKELYTNIKNEMDKFNE